ELLLGGGPQAQPGHLADHVAAGLARRYAVALDLSDRPSFSIADRVHVELDRLLAGPALGVHACVDDETYRTEYRILEHAQLSPPVLRIQAHLVRELLGVERPTFAVAGEPDRLAQHRDALRFE